jgi:hypothetical protein
VDVSGIQTWQEGKVVEHVVFLAEKMRRNQRAVPVVWRAGKFVVVEKDLVDADKFTMGSGNVRNE